MHEQSLLHEGSLLHKSKKKYNNKKITYQGLGVTVAVKKKLNLINKNKTIQTKNTNKKIKNWPKVRVRYNSDSKIKIKKSNWPRVRVAVIVKKYYYYKKKSIRKKSKG